MEEFYNLLIEMADSFSADTLIALCAIIIAGLSFYLARKQFQEVKEHHRLSSAPYVSIDANISPHAGDMGIFLYNKGVGPAILREMKIYVKNDKYDGLSNKRCFWNEIFTKLGLNEGDKYKFIVRYLDKGEYLPANEKKWLISLSERYDPEKNRDFVIEIITNIRIELKYFSIYNEWKKTAFDVSELICPPTKSIKRKFARQI